MDIDNLISDKPQKPLSAEKIKEKRAIEKEKIKEMGQESEVKAAKVIKEEFKERQKKEIETQGISFDILHRLKNNKLKYNMFLRKLMYRFLQDEDIPKKYIIDVTATKKGVIFSIRGTKYIGALGSCGIEKIDFFVLRAKAAEIGNTVSHLEGYRAKSEGGIVLADQADLKKYGKHRNI